MSAKRNYFIKMGAHLFIKYRCSAATLMYVCYGIYLFTEWYIQYKYEGLGSRIQVNTFY